VKRLKVKVIRTQWLFAQGRQVTQILNVTYKFYGDMQMTLQFLVRNVV